MSCRLSVAIPSFNEGDGPRAVVLETIETFDRSGLRDFELLIIDDGSELDSAEALDQLPALDSRIRVIRHPGNRGFGAALQTGYAHAGGTFVSLLPADGQIPPSVIVDLLHQLGDDDLITSARTMDAPWHRRLLTSFWRALMLLFFRYDSHRAQGIYVVRRSLLEGLTFRSRTGLFNFELLMQCAARTRRVKVGETIVRPRRSGDSKVANLRTVGRTLLETIRLRSGW